MSKNIHTQLQEPQVLRKSILETALSTTEALQTIKKIQQVQEEKTTIKNKITQTLQRLRTNITTLKKSISPFYISDSTSLVCLLFVRESV